MSSDFISPSVDTSAQVAGKERLVERDAGFVSGGDDDDSCSGPAHSDDSGVRLAEPRQRSPARRPRSTCSLAHPPPKKRLRRASRDAPSPGSDASQPFRPWSFTDEPQEEPLSLVKKTTETTLLRQRRRPVEPPPPPIPPPAEVRAETAARVSVADSTERRPREQRNYKNMTRERRIEANARERTRVHTISAAFDTLRRAVPAYSHNQKLSKLSVLRVACAYIAALAAAATPEEPAPLAAAVAAVTHTIHTEGKLKKKKDDP